MSGYWSTLLPGLTLAAITAAAYMAYNHPKAYAKLANPIGVASFFVFVGSIVWDLVIGIGDGIATKNFSSISDAGVIKKIQENFSEVAISGRFIIVVLAVFLYLLLLEYLPELLKLDKKPHSDDGEKGSNKNE